MNSDYEMNFPIAQQVSIQLLEDKRPAGKVVLQDDGKGGDENAGDNKFSIILKEDISSLTTELEELQSRTREFTQEPAFEFVARHKVKLNVKGLRQFDFSAFKAACQSLFL